MSFECRSGHGEASFCGGTRFRASAVILGCLVLLAAPAFAQPRAIFLVRHAERAAVSGRVPSDTGLSREGKSAPSI
jgi:hypothetical protein